MPTLLNGKSSTQKLNVDQVVKERYAGGARQREAELCCPVTYDRKYLKILPQEILEKDYGCGDPSRYVQEGDVVLDLGSGAGKICYIAAQAVGPKGRVIGVDFNPAMLKLARKHQAQIAKRIGWDNVDFRWGRIQDLRTDLAQIEARLKKTPVKSTEDLIALQAYSHEHFQKKPLVADGSVDIVVSNCVLNLVDADEKQSLFREIFRVLKVGGRFAISDIVSDELVPMELQNQADLWSGCISGAFQETEFIKAFEAAGFYGMQIEKRDAKPWRVVRGIEFRSVTVTGFKGKEGPCLERNQAVIYKGPWKAVCDDDGHMLKRGLPMAVCDKTFKIYTKEPYARDILALEPARSVPLTKATPFNCRANTVRDYKLMKSGRKARTQSDCEGESCC